MRVKREGLAFIVLLILSVGLIACSNNDDSSANETEAERENNAEEESGPMSLSDAFEKYPLWYEVNLNSDLADPDRESDITAVFVFKDDSVDLRESFLEPTFDLTLDDIADKSDEEAFQKIMDVEEEYLEEKATDYEESDDPMIQNEYEGAPEALEEVKNIDGLGDMKDSEKYTLDLWLDDQGQGVEYEGIIISSEDFSTIKVDPNGFNVPIFDEAYAGFHTEDGDRAFITKVEDESVQFELDDEDSDKEQITIEEEKEDED